MATAFLLLFEPLLLVLFSDAALDGGRFVNLSCAVESVNVVGIDANANLVDSITSDLL